jgi:hypothetical protein
MYSFVMRQVLGSSLQAFSCKPTQYHDKVSVGQVTPLILMASVLCVSVEQLWRFKTMANHRIVLMAAMLAVSSMALGQITIQSTDLSGPGTLYTAAGADNVTFNVGQVGGNQTWTFGDYAWVTPHEIRFLNPASAPHGSQFPAATRANFEYFSEGSLYNNYSFEQIAPDGEYYLGGVRGDTICDLADPPIRWMPLPVTYQTTWFLLSRDTIINIPGYVEVHVDYTTHNINAWGTVQTPYGTYSCLRDYVHEIRESYVNGEAGYYFEHVGYGWIDQNGRTVVSVTARDGVINQNFSTGSIGMIGVPLVTDPARALVVSVFAVGQNYPNPFNSTTTLPITLEKNGLVTVDVFDALGRLASHSVTPMSVGIHTVPINGSAWASGNYFARVSTPERRQTVGMQLIK